MGKTIKKGDLESLPKPIKRIRDVGKAVDKRMMGTMPESFQRMHKKPAKKKGA